MIKLDTNQLWQAVCGELELSISPASFSSWVRPCYLASVTDLDSERYLVELACPSSYNLKTVDERYYGQIKKALENQLERKCELALVVKQKNKPEVSPPSEGLFSQALQSAADFSEAIVQSGLNPKFSFTNFVVGSSNDLAFAAAKAIVDTPGAKHNPLFIWGGVGVGKTHLMHAIGRGLVEKGYKKIRVLTSEQFLNELIITIRSHSVEGFKKKYREADAILIDDIQFIASKDTAQEEFFHTFNELYAKQKQIIMTSDRRPQDIQQVEQRLISRFLGGLTVDIGLPDYEMRCAILRQRAEELNIVTGDEAIETIANYVNTNARELEGTFTSLVNVVSLKGGILTKELVQTQLNLPSSSHPTTSASPTKRLRAQEVISKVAKHFNLKNKDLVGHNRKADLVRARQITMYLLREELGLQLQRIAQLMGGRDHTTVMYGVEKMKKEIGLNSEIREQISVVRSQLYQ